LEYARASSPLEIERRAQKLGLERPDKKTADKPANANANVKARR